MNSNKKYFHKRLGNYTEFGYTRLLIVFFAILSLTNINGQTFTLDVLEISDDGKVSLTIPDSNKVSVTLVTTGLGAQPVNVNLHLSEFKGEDNNTIPVYMKLPSLQDTIPEPNKTITIDKKLIPIILQVDSLATFGQYTGKLFLTSGTQQVMVWVITLSKMRQFTPAELIIDQREMEFNIHKTFLGIGKEDAINVTMRDNKNQWPLEGITMTLEDASAPGGKLTIDNFAVSINGNEIENISSWPPELDSPNYADQIRYRQIPRNGIANIRIGFKDLSYGNYSVTLRFRAVNSVTTDTQTVKLKFAVQHSIVWAIIVLLFAIIMSFIGTKILSNIRQKSLLQKRISELNHSWLKSEPAYLPVIWVRAMLRQCYKLSNSRWFTSPRLISEKIDQVEEFVTILKKIRETRITITNLDEPDLTKKRLKLELDKIISRMGSDPLDEDTKTLINNNIDELRSALTIDNITGSYWLKFKSCLNDLLDSISLGDIENPDQAKELKKLMDTLYESRDNTPKDMNEVAAVEAIYSKLKILWTRRNTNEFGKLIDNIVQQQSLESFFQVADKAIWEKMKKTKLTITPPQASGPNPFKTFQPLLYRLISDDPIIRNSYLFKRGLVYKWKFEMCENISPQTQNADKPGEKKPQTISQCSPLIPITLEPRVVQFTPWVGLFKASLEIKYNNESISIENGKQVSTITAEDGTTKENIIDYEEKPITISKSEAFGWYNWLNKTEYISVMISIIFAVITGLGTFYYAEAGFGSMKDYIALFLWGAGVDQTKNALQIIQTNSGDKATQ